MNAKKMSKKLAASVLTCTMILGNSLPLFASEEYPTSTTNKDDVVTIEKSAAWNGETAQDADFFATVTLKASGIQNVVGELVTTKPVDIGIVLDESGSMAACLNPSHTGNYPMVYASDLKTDNQTKAIDALKASKKPADLREWIVKVDALAGDDYDVYLTPIKTTATADDLSGWGAFMINKNGSIRYFSDLFDDSCTVSYAAFAPYFVGHFEMDGLTPVKHIVEAHSTDYYLATPVQNGSGWRSSEHNPLIPSADFRNVAALKNTEECEFYHDVIRDSAKNFITKLGQEYANGKLGEESTVSLVPFAGVVDTINMVAPISLGASDVVNIVNGKIDKAYEALGMNTNWGDAMDTAADQLNSKGNDRQKFVVFFTDGDPDMSDAELTAENLTKALNSAQSLYVDGGQNHMYGVFLNRAKADIGKMNRLVNAMNLNQPDSTKNSSYVSVVDNGTSAEDIGADLESVFNSILTDIEKWSKSTMIISLEDTISSYFTIDREKLDGNEGEDWTVEITEDGLEKITFYAEVDGFTEFDQLEKKIPVKLKEDYHYTTAYYPTNEGNAVCIYINLEGENVSVGTSTPYLPVDNTPNVVKDILSVNESEAQNGDIVTVGDVIEYQISYENNTKEMATITITDNLPKGTEFVSADNGGKFADGSIVWNLADVEAGFEGVVTFRVKVTSDAENRIDNAATVKIGENEFETNKISNPLIKKEVVSVNGVDGSEDAMLMVGDKIIYSVWYSNITDEPVDIMITDMVPKGTKFVEASDGGVLDGDAVAWTLLQVNPGTFGSVTMTVEVTEEAVEQIENSAVVVIGESKRETNRVVNPVEVLVEEEPKEEKPFEDTNKDKEIDYNEVKTGDDFNPYLWIGLGVLSWAGIVVVILRYRKLKKENIE